MAVDEEGKDVFAESIEFVPEDFGATQDALEDEFQPEVADDQREATETPEVQPASASTDEQPKVDLESIGATLKKVQDRLDKAEARAGYWQRQAEKRPAETPQATTPEPKVDVPPEPKYDDFENDEAYYRALVDHKVEAKLATMEAKRTADAQQVASQQQAQTFQQRLFEDGTGKYTDFTEVVSDPTLPITNEIVDILRESEKPADIAYYLGKNPQEAVRIARLTPYAAAREIGKIEAKIMADETKPTARPKPTISNAPPPINPIRGGQSIGVVKDPEKMGNQEYREWRRAQKR